MDRNEYKTLVNRLTDGGINSIWAKAFVNVMESRDVYDLYYIDGKFGFVDKKLHEAFSIDKKGASICKFDDGNTITRISLPVYLQGGD